MLQGITTYLADNIARLHEPLHLKGFSYLLGSSSNVANISAVSHIPINFNLQAFCYQERYRIISVLTYKFFMTLLTSFLSELGKDPRNNKTHCFCRGELLLP